MTDTIDTLLMSATQAFDLDGPTDADKLFDRAQRHAADIYIKHGHVPSMIVLASTQSGRAVMHVTDVDVYLSFFRDPTVAKLVMMRSVRRLARKIEAYLYIAVLNAWSARSASGEDLADNLRKHGSIKDMPGAIDSLVFLMESRSGTKMSTIKVDRGPDGETVSLSSPDVVEGYVFQGMMTGVIPTLRAGDRN